MNRRRFNKSLMMLMALSAVPVSVSAAGKKPKRVKLIKPERLRKGDLVGLVTPGSHISDKGLEQSVKNLESLGLRVKISKNIRASRGYTAGTKQERLDDLHDMFSDKEVKGVWAARGGHGCGAILPDVDYGLIKKNPKVFIGYSDITALHCAIYNKTGLVTFHGPVASSTFSDYSVEHMVATLMEPTETHTIPFSAKNREKAQTNPFYKDYVLHKGICEGRLLGGNLSLLASIAGTPYECNFEKSLLFLEDIGESPYRIDRMLTQLDQNVGLNKAAGVLMGVFEDAKPPEGEPSLTMREALDDNLGHLKTPTVYGYSFGHIARQFTLPMGIKARLDTEKETVTLLEPAVL